MSNQTGAEIQAELTKSRTTNFIRESFTSNFWMSGLAILKIHSTLVPREASGWERFLHRSETRRVSGQDSPGHTSESTAMGNDDRSADVASPQFVIWWFAWFL